MWKRFNLNYCNREQEFDLLHKIANIREEIENAAQQYAPHRIVRYVYELASLFHSYYKAERVITENSDLSKARLSLLRAIQIVLQNVLKLIGVTAPDQM